MKKQFDFEERTPYVHYVGQNQKLLSPHRAPTPRSDWATPLLQSVTIATLFGVILAGLSLAAKVRADTAIVFAGACALIVCLVTFVLFVNRTHKSIFHTVERVKPKTDNYTRPIVHSSRGKWQDPRAKEWRVEDNEEEEEQETCPYPDGTMRWFVWWCAREGTTYEVWEKILGRGKYLEWRDSLIQSGWAAWSVYNAKGEPSNTQGWELIRPADVICANIKE